MGIMQSVRMFVVSKTIFVYNTNLEIHRKCCSEHFACCVLWKLLLYAMRYRVDIYTPEIIYHLALIYVSLRFLSCKMEICLFHNCVFNFFFCSLFKSLPDGCSEHFKHTYTQRNISKGMIFHEIMCE